MKTKTTTAFLSIAAALALPATAATISFTNDFDTVGFTGGSGFSAPSGGAISSTVTGTAVPIATATEQFTNAFNASFTITTQFRFTSIGTQAGDQTVGLALFANNATLGGGSVNPYLVADYNFNSGAEFGRLRLINLAATNTVVGTLGTADTNGATAGVVNINTIYTLRLSAIAAGSNTYNLSLGLFDEAGTTQFGTSAATTTPYSAIAEPSGGFHFGLRTRLPNNGGTTTVQFLNYSIVPEPTTALLGLLGSLTLFKRRRN